MERPGPGHGDRGFLVQRNHESGGIVIVYSLPERCDSGNSATSTFCNRDIFTIPTATISIQPPNCRHCGARMKLVRELPWLGRQLPAIRLFQCAGCGHVDMIEWPDAEGKESP
jgi:hypothetical protein